MKRTDRHTTQSIAVNPKRMYQIETRLAAGGSVWKTVAEVLWTRENNGIRTAFLGELIGHQDWKAASATGWMDWYTQPMERLRSASYNGARHWSRGAGLDSDELILEQAWRGELPAHFEGWWTPGASRPPGGYGHHPRVDDPRVSLCGATPLMTGVKDGPTNPDGSVRMCPVCVAKKAELAAV